MTNTAKRVCQGMRMVAAVAEAQLTTIVNISTSNSIRSHFTPALVVVMPSIFVARTKFSKNFSVLEIFSTYSRKMEFSTVIRDLEDRRAAAIWTTTINDNVIQCIIYMPEIQIQCFKHSLAFHIKTLVSADIRPGKIKNQALKSLFFFSKEILLWIKNDLKNNIHCFNRWLR